MQASHCHKVDPRWTDEYGPSAAPLQISWHAKDLVMSPEVDPDTGEIQLHSYGMMAYAHESPDVFMMFYNVLIITSKIWDLIMYPSVQCSYNHFQNLGFNHASIGSQLWNSDASIKVAQFNGLELLTTF